MNSFDEFCRSRCLFTMSYVAMSFRQMSFVAVNYGQDEFCRRSRAHIFSRTRGAQRILEFLLFIASFGAPRPSVHASDFISRFQHHTVLIKNIVYCIYYLLSQ